MDRELDLCHKHKLITVVFTCTHTPPSLCCLVQYALGTQKTHEMQNMTVYHFAL